MMLDCIGISGSSGRSSAFESHPGISTWIPGAERKRIHTGPV